MKTPISNVARLTIIAILIAGAANLNAQERFKVKTEVENKTPPIVRGEAVPHLFGELPVESFEGETFPPEGWSKVTNFGGTGWQRVTVGSRVIGFNPSTEVDASENGGEAVALCSWGTGDADGNPQTGQRTEQWLITPQITNIVQGDSLIFHLKYFVFSPDTLDVLISTGEDTIPDFTTVVDTLAFSESDSDAWIRYSYVLTDFVAPGADIYVAFRQHIGNTAEEGGAFFLDLVEVAEQVTSVTMPDVSPGTFTLHQNYPNPFNPTTQIAFELPARAQVSVKVFDLRGQVVATLLDERSYPQGQHTIEFDASDLANGVYFYELQAAGAKVIRRMTLLK